MHLNYDSALNLLKRSFIGSEGPLWVQEVAQQFPLIRRLDVCDIGIGNGESINKKLVALHQKGYDIHLSGIDPYLHIDALAMNISASICVNAYKTTFEAYPVSQRFDIANATHSLYYVQNQEHCISKLINMLNERGLLLITLWSESCVLYKLHRKIYEHSRNTINGEIVYDLLSQYSEITDIKMLESETGIDISQWKTSMEMINAALLIISRNIGEIDIDAEKRETLLRTIHSLPDVVTRRNIMLVARK